MADDNMVMSESDISALRETLCAQQQLLQKLYNELDAEREASATAASEALSVILRLQGEKAAIKMEAEQYKRLSEEKIGHAEESLAIIEDMIYSKEMEVAALDHQVQAYRCKLLSMGCADLGLGNTKSSENPLQSSESLAGESSLQSIGRRNSVTLPIKFRKVSCERDGCMNADVDLVPKVVEEQMRQDVSDQVFDLDKKASNLSSMDINSYWEQIRRLGERVKEIAGANYANSLSETRSRTSVSSQLSAGNSCDLSNNIGTRTRSPSPQISLCGPYDSNMLATVNETEETTSSSNYAKNSVAGDCSSSPSVHDVFEVPQVVQDFSSAESVVKCEKKTASQGSGSLKRDVIHPEAVEVHSAKEKPDWLKKKALKSAQRKKKLCRQNPVAIVNRHLAVANTSTSTSEYLPGTNHLNRTSEIIEVERAAEDNNRGEELKLLNEIKEEINSLREEVRSWKVKKLPPRNEPSLSSLQEAMLYFWL